MAQGVQIKIKKQKKSVLKRNRMTARRTAVNRSNRTRVRTELKRMRAAIAAGDAARAQALLPATLGMLDRAIQLGVLHENTANRYKSRLSRAVHRLRAAQPG